MVLSSLDNNYIKGGSKVLKDLAYTITEKEEDLEQLKSQLTDELIKASGNDCWGFDKISFFDIDEEERGEKGLIYETEHAAFTELTYWDISHEPLTVLVVSVK